MNKTIVNLEPADRRTVDTKGLQQILGVGRQTSVEIGEAAEAKITVGRRVLWNIAKIQRYLDSISE